ncbi:NUDIX hydrolase [Solibacillus daqui]|uniref:NUDIX hydrolase n=1 Tax=Solibacillus daqui TaxID=2912187 RepID=UPI002366B68E|nr:CoA pyrophosphatase [Solibacillus daqui]
MFLEKLKGQLEKPQPLFLGEETAFRSAVLIPLVEKNGEWYVLFEVRALTMRKQPGDISFPGGKIDDSDASPLAAALRETQEELGIDPQSIQLIGHLSPFVTSPAFVVYPFIGVIEEAELNHYNRDEVEELFMVPLNWLMTHEPYVHYVPMEPKPPADFPYDKIVNGENYQWRANRMEEWFYEHGNYTIWGLTARLLKHFIEKMK